MITYRPLRDLLYNNNIKMIDLIKDNIVTPNQSVKLNNDRGSITLITLQNIVFYLSDKLNKEITPNDIIKFAPDTKTD